VFICVFLAIDGPDSKMFQKHESSSTADWGLVELSAGNGSLAFDRRVRVGIVGGGTDSVIGRTHLIAMRADGLCDLVAGAMSVDPEIALSA
jgi:hypothetical protein